MTDDYEDERYEPTPEELARHKAECEAIIAANPGVPLWVLFQWDDIVTPR